MKPRRLLFVDGHPATPGGAQVNLIELLGHPHARTRWEIRVACDPASPLSGALTRQRILRQHYRHPEPVGRLGRLFRLGTARHREQAARRLQDLLAGFQPEAVISCSGRDHLAAGMAAAASGIPSVWWVNENLTPDFFSWAARRTFVSEALAHATRLVPVSHYGAAALKQAGVPENRIRVVHNGIPLRRYQRGHSTLLRRQLRLKPGEPLIGFVGRITPWKGPRFFLELAERWAAERRPGRFVLLGPVAREDEAFAACLREFVRDRGLRGRVSFPPPPASEADALAQIDLLIHCSIKPEPFGRVIIEGMAAGVPVIGACDGGVPEIITQGVNGGMAAPGNLTDYLARLTAVLGNPAMRTAWVNAGHRTVQQRFTLDRVFDDFEGVFEELARAARPTSARRSPASNDPPAAVAAG